MTVQERIRKLMEVKGWSEYRLAKEAHLPQSLSQFFADEGEAVVLTEEQKEWMLLWGSLSEEQRSIIKATMKNFSEE